MNLCGGRITSGTEIKKTNNNKIIARLSINLSHHAAVASSAPLLNKSARVQRQNANEKNNKKMALRKYIYIIYRVYRVYIQGNSGTSCRIDSPSVYPLCLCLSSLRVRASTRRGFSDFPYKQGTKIICGAGECGCCHFQAKRRSLSLSLSLSMVINASLLCALAGRTRISCVIDTIR